MYIHIGSLVLKMLPKNLALIGQAVSEKKKIIENGTARTHPMVYIYFICISCFESCWMSLDNWCGMSCNTRKPVFGFPTRADTNQPVQSKKKARSLKFCI